MQSTQTSERHSFTLQEILSQPHVWRDSLNELHANHFLQTVVEKISSASQWLFVGCGTSYYLAEAAAASWTLLTGQLARALPASELLLFPGLTLARSAGLQAVIISRSGSTSEAVRAAKLLSREYGVPTLGLTCAANSPLEAECAMTIRLSTADEQSVVMTRSFTSMLLALQQLAGRKNAESSFFVVLEKMPGYCSKQIQALANRTEAFVAGCKFADYIFLGQGPFHAVAREASLKITEMSCSYSQVYHTLEFRHGPKAIVAPEICLTFFLSESGYQAEAEVLSEMKETIIAVCNRASESVRRSSDFIFEFGLDGPELATLAPFAVFAQLLGYYTGIKKGLNPDQPRNLSRVVILD